MKKHEFMDQLYYFFRTSDKEDLKDIAADCEEQFRLGKSQGKSEEEICCKLGAPKNIYRYYIGKPIIPEENPTMPEAPDYTSLKNTPSGYDNAPYDWDKEPERLRRRTASDSYYRQPVPPASPYDRTDPYADRRQTSDQHHRPYVSRSGPPEETGDFQWNGNGSSTAATAAKAVATPILQIVGTIFYAASGLLFVALAAGIVASFALTSMPQYVYTDLLPLPVVATPTLIFANLTILFAALTALYAGQYCSHPHFDSSPSGRRRS